MEKRSFFQIFKFPLVAAIVIWAAHILKVGLNLPLNRLGILPREVYGLKGIIFAPMVHGDWAHLISNTAPLMVMCFILSAFYSRVAFKSFFLIYIITGAAVWIFARSSFHIGASGVVYGLVSFVFWLGVFRRNLKSIAIALVILFLYGGLLWGVLPTQPGVSWESHLMGGIVGIIVAFLFRNVKEIGEVDPVYDLGVDEPKKPYFDSNIFEEG